METKDAPVVEEKDTKEEVVEKDTKEVEKEATVGEQLGTDKKEVESKPQAKTVPEAVFLDLKSELKELKQSIKDNDKSKSEIVGDMDDIAKKYDIKPEFLNELVGAIQTKTKKEFDAELEDRLKPLKDKEKSEKIETAFSKAYDKAIESAPEFKDVVNREVIKALSLNPANASKTFKQIMEESYGHLVTGKRTLDHSGGSGRAETPGKVDFDRISKDTKYYAEVMTNPTLRAEYNSNMTDRLKSII